MVHRVYTPDIEQCKAGWCIPGINMGPDLMARLWLSDGRLLLLVIQAKSRTVGNADTVKANALASGIWSLIPERYFHSLVCNQLGILLDFSLTVVCL